MKWIKVENKIILGISYLEADAGFAGVVLAAPADLELLEGVTGVAGVAAPFDLEALAGGVALLVLDSVAPLVLVDLPDVTSISIWSGSKPKLSNIFFFLDDSVAGAGAFLGGGVGFAAGFVFRVTPLLPKIMLDATLLLCNLLMDLRQASLNLLLSLAA